MLELYYICTECKTKKPTELGEALPESCTVCDGRIPKFREGNIVPPFELLEQIDIAGNWKTKCLICGSISSKNRSNISRGQKSCGRECTTFKIVRFNKNNIVVAECPECKLTSGYPMTCEGLTCKVCAYED